MEWFIEAYIRAIFQGLADKVNEVSNLIAKTPEELFGAAFWENLIQICTLAFMPFALAVIGFFIAAELYEVYCKANGELDIQLVSATVFKFIFPYLLVTRSYDLMQIIFDVFNTLIKSLGDSFGVVLQPTQAQMDAMIDSVYQMNFFELLGALMTLVIPYTLTTIMGGIVYIIVYGRLFEIMLYWLIAPIPLSTLPSGEHSQIAKNFLKMMAAIMLQGVLMILCIVIYAQISITVSLPTNIDFFSIWNMIWPMALLIFALLKSGALAKRICGTF